MPDQEKIINELKSELDSLKTRLKQADEQNVSLIKTSEDWNFIFNAIHDSICILDKDRNILQCNSAMCALTGKTPDELNGKNCCTVVHGSAGTIENCPLTCAYDSGKREKRE
ncbi:MAG: PAS domain-containing protein, partial [Candidatus Omnitrophota bacterium]